MSAVSSDLSIIQPAYRLTCTQRFWLAVQAGLLASVITWQCLANQAAFTRFCTGAEGLGMALAALVLLAINFGGQVIAYVTLNNRHSTLSRALMVVVSGGALAFFYLPAGFVLWIGPSAVQIRAALQAG